MCVSHVCGHQWSPKEGIVCSGAGVTGGCEHLPRLLGTKLGSSGRSANAFKHCTISLVLETFFTLGTNSKMILFMSASLRDHVDGLLAIGEFLTELLGLMVPSPSGPISACCLVFLQVHKLPCPLSPSPLLLSL